MKLDFEGLRWVCSMDVFLINDIEANEDDFGDGVDISPSQADAYCCGNRQFIRHDLTPEILAKYSIDENDYATICQKLEDGLSFGNCGLCT